MALIVKVNGVEYRVPLSVSDITLRTHLEIVKAEERMPKEMKQIIEERNIERRQLMSKRLSKIVYARKFIPYYATIIGLATGIPRNQILGDKTYEGMPVPMIEQWYWEIMSAYAKFESDDTRSTFEINGETWTLPEAMMEKSTFGQFAEAAQYEDYVADVAGGNWEAMPKVMAVLLRPEGEKFDPDEFDDIIDERAEIMLNQTMDVAYQVSFFLLARSQSLSLDSLIYTISRQLGTYRQGSRN